jgi:SAM-dependent methyltransferase/methyltransferase-like protein
MIESYEAVPYTGHPFAQAHPDRMATMAILHGMNPPSVETCRVLELGCGDGGNLVSMAYGLPCARFSGIDLSPSAIRRGKEVVDMLGLRNLRLEALDLRQVDGSFGEFDYIVAYGLYSWVEPEVRDHILTIIHDHLAPNGVAYVNYNAQPGGHLRQALREMMLIHVRDIDEPQERIAQVRALLEFLNQALAGHGDYGAFVAGESERVLRFPSEALFHDLLAENYAPMWFGEFIAHAGRQALQFLSEAEYSDLLLPVHLSAGVARVIEEIPDALMRQQYVDFVRCRKFRQTLLCHAGVAVARKPVLERIAGLLAGSEVKPASEHPNLEEGAVEEFAGPQGQSLKTAHPVVKALMIELCRAWPRYLPVAELRERVGRPDPRELAEVLLRSAASTLITLHAWAPRPAPAAGEHPVASALARAQAVHTGRVTTLLHASVQLTGPLERHLVTLLDGTLDRAGLLRELSEFAGGQVSAADLERSLSLLARLGLLEA